MVKTPQEWLEVRESQPKHPELAHLDKGEREAIELALAYSIRIVLMDELKGRRSAEALNLIVRGTIGVLVQGAQSGFIDLPSALDKLQQQRFYISHSIKRDILREYHQGKTE
jgi:predicted nucleic acid-binding protein